MDAERQTKTETIAVPEDLAPYIFEDEQMLRISQLPQRVRHGAPSSLHELYRLAQAKIRSDIGELPPLASLGLETDVSQNDGEHLHRYEALFGRDSLRVAVDTLPLFPRLARATLLALAEVQGTQNLAAREEEPGRIAHEVRDLHDPIAQKLTQENGWQWPYYGSVDATPEFIRTLSQYCQQAPEGNAFLFQHYKNKDGQSLIVADGLSAAVDWMTHRLDANPEHLLEFQAAFPGSITNQAWKDSPDAYFHTNGELANHDQGIASVEVQRVAYDALLDAADFYHNQLGRKDEAAQLRERADLLKKAIFDNFWTEEEGGFFVLGTDRDEDGRLRQLKIKTSNMGHLLNSRLLEGDQPELNRYRQAIIRQLFSPQMLNVSGIRSLASDEKRFRPGAYHNGSVWLWDTHFIAKGLRRHGYNHLSQQLTDRIFNVIKVTEKFPEYVRGDEAAQPSLNNRLVEVWDKTYGYANTIEQPPQEVQAWSVAAVVAMKYYRGHHAADSQAAPDDFEKSILNTLPSLFH